MTIPRLLALSDLHVAHPQNREIVAGLPPGSDDDWLLLAGDVGESVPPTSSGRCAPSPANTPPWCGPRATTSCGPGARTRSRCAASNGTWPWSSSAGKSASGPRRTPTRYGHGPGGPVTVAPVFLLYDYTFRPDGALTKEEGLEIAYEKGIVCQDEAAAAPRSPCQP